MDTNTVTPGTIAAAYEERERGVRALLDDLDRAALEGNHSEVRERIRTFADEEREVFLAVALALAGTEEFFEQVERERTQEVATALETIGEEYPSLSDPFRLVRLEVSKERTNPITSIDVVTAYDTDRETPLVGYTVSTGDVELYEHRGTPQEVLDVAAYIVQGTNDSLTAALEGGHSVNTDELSGLIDSHQKLESQLNTLYDHIDELRRKPVE